LKSAAAVSGNAAPSVPLPAGLPWILGLAVAVLFGTLLPDLWRVAALVMGITLAAAFAGVGPLLTLLVVTAGLTLAPLTDNQRSLLPELGGLNFEGLRLLSALAAFAWVAATDGAVLRVPKWLTPYLAFLGFGAASLLWSSDRTDGVRLLMKLSYPIAAFLLVTRGSKSTAGIKRLVVWSAIAATAANLVAALVYGPSFDPDFAGRFGGFLGYNLLGHFCAITALAFYAWGRNAGERRYLILFLIMLAQLVASGSRTALLSLGIGLFAFDLIQRRWRWMATTAAAGAAIWLLVPTLGARTVLAPISAIAPGTPEWATGLNLSGRLIIWHDVWSSMVAWGEPWGRGLGSTAAFLASRYETIRHVHNEFLRLLAEIGPPGLALFLLGYGSLVATSWRVRRGNAEAAPHAALVLAAVAMFFASSFTENTFEYFSVFSLFVWIYAGMAMSRGDHESRAAAGG
jgi:hypothetical protein